MGVKLLRRILALLIVTAYVGAMVKAAPTYAAHADMNHSSMNGMMHEHDSPDDRMPCKGMLPNCVTDIGCVFLVCLPVPDLTLVAMTAWSSVIYDNTSEGSRGHIIEPALGPPIPIA
jgi:hypothetical protein